MSERDGFSWHDVVLLKALAWDLRRSAHVNYRPEGRSARYADEANDLAERIAARLPPSNRPPDGEPKSGPSNPCRHRMFFPPDSESETEKDPQ